MNFSPWPVFADDEIAAVERVLRSGKVNYWTGDEGKAFEAEFAAMVGSDHAIALANGTLALDLALHGLGIGAGDEVIVSPRSFIASASCVVNAGAVPVFADVDRESGCLSAGTIEPMITPRTKAVIVVHLGGWPVEMAPIMALVQQHGFFVIEDCAQAHGARDGNAMVGSIGHVGAFSFCQDKIMTTGGEGGMVTTSDPALWKRMWAYKDHGKDWDVVHRTDHPPGFRWLHRGFGTNMRMTEPQAAIGRVQLGKLGSWVERRNRHAAQLRSAFDDLRLRQPQPHEASRHAHYRHYAYILPERLRSGWDRDRIVSEIVKCGVPCFQGSCSEIYREQAFDGTNLRPAEPLPGARELGETSLAWLVHPTLSDEEIARMAAVSAEILEQALA